MKETRNEVLRAASLAAHMNSINMRASYIGVEYFLSRAEEYYFELHKHEIVSNPNADANFIRESFEKIPAMFRGESHRYHSAGDVTLDDFREDFFNDYFKQNPDIDVVYIMSCLTNWEAMQIRPELKGGFCQKLFDFSYDEEYTNSQYQDGLG